MASFQRILCTSQQKPRQHTRRARPQLLPLPNSLKDLLWSCLTPHSTKEDSGNTNCTFNSRTANPCGFVFCLSSSSVKGNFRIHKLDFGAVSAWKAQQIHQPEMSAVRWQSKEKLNQRERNSCSLGKVLGKMSQLCGRALPTPSIAGRPWPTAPTSPSLLPHNPCKHSEQCCVWTSRQVII